MLRGDEDDCLLDVGEGPSPHRKTRAADPRGKSGLSFTAGLVLGIGVSLLVMVIVMFSPESCSTQSAGTASGGLGDSVSLPLLDSEPQQVLEFHREVIVAQIQREEQLHRNAESGNRQPLRGKTSLEQSQGNTEGGEERPPLRGRTSLEQSHGNEEGGEERPPLRGKTSLEQSHGNTEGGEERPALRGRTSAAGCGVTESDRFDCWPQVKGVNQSLCEARGCCWLPSLNVKVPACFYPIGYVSYAVQSSSASANGMSAKLQRKSASPYPNDVLTLQVDVTYESKSTVRFKIYDPNHKRYEVPLNVSKAGPAPTDTEYQVVLQDSPFGIAVTRKSTGAVLFDSRDMAPLVFADQFLQVGTRLSTPYAYGLGEHQAAIALDLDWNRLVLYARDQAPDGGGNLYGYHPFYLNLEEGGNAHGVFLLSSNALEVALQPYLGGVGGLTYRVLGGVLDFYVFSGPSPLAVVEQYVSKVGRPFLPPFWALGFHLCKYGYMNIQNLTSVIARNRAANIPYDVQWSDIDYMAQYKDWTFDSNGSYKGLDKLVDDLHAHNQRYVMIIDPGISSVQPVGTYPPYDDGVKMDIFIKNATGQILIGKVWPGETAFPDFFHPDAENYWYKQMASYYNSVKFNGIWLDMNEISNFVEGSTVGCTNNSLDKPPYVPPGINGQTLSAKTICPSALQALSTSYNLHSMYGYSEMRATAAGLQRLLGKRQFILSRSTFAGSGFYGAHWTGDNQSGWKDLYYSIPSILNINLFGISMAGADVCGFMGNTTRELCIRWMQLGSFYPFMRNHADLAVRMPQDPASFDSEAVNYMRSALETRYSLLPFMYTQMYLSHTKGTPPVRPLFMMFPHTELVDRQFMWGDAVLVSPVLEQGAVQVDAYFPEGVWYDLYTGALVTRGPQSLVLDAPLSVIHAHIRGGSILPRLPPAVTTNQMRTKPFFLLVAPDDRSQAQGLLYWDDGESLDPVKNFNYSLVNLTLNGDTLTNEVLSSNFAGLPLNAVYVSGIESKPLAVVQDGSKAADFTYNSTSKVLSVINLTIDLLTPFTLNWTL